MLQYFCDWCKRRKKPGENWILGFAAEKSNSSGYRREVSFATAWTEEWARHALAVHFCSEEHKKNYIDVLIGGARLPRRRTEKLHTATSVSTGSPAATVADVPQPPATSRQRRHRKSEPLAPEFTEADSLRAHALGIYLPQGDDRQQAAQKAGKLSRAKQQHSLTTTRKPRQLR